MGLCPQVGTRHNDQIASFLLKSKKLSAQDNSLQSSLILLCKISNGAVVEGSKQPIPYNYNQ